MVHTPEQQELGTGTPAASAAASTVWSLRQLLDIVCERAGLDRYQAYSLLSIAGDRRVTQVVNGNKGVHLMLEKRYLERG